ncbi:MAG: Ig-like domain-containing protein, partial [Pseudomonas sp.]|uniref:Ig-like domain-containing protein n=1 Tax=Pseudomonas sp. TaxID=306 RepID=UPI003BB7B18C
PTASIVVADTALGIGETSTVTITFNEAVSGLAIGDFTVANGALSGLVTGDGGITWTGTLTPTASITDTSNLITLDNTSVADAAGNIGSGTTDSNNYAIDTLRPTASVVVTDTALTAGETSNVTITFNEAVSGLTTADFTVANGVLSGLSSSDGGISWTATLTPTASIEDTTNLIVLDNTGLADAAGNTGTGSSNSNNYALDTLRPTAGIVVADTALTIGETSSVTITFNEAVSGLTTADFTVANGALSGLSSSDGGITWTATLTPTASVEDTTNLIALDNTGVQDAAGNTGTGSSNSNNYAIDTLRPTASVVVTDTALAAGETSTVTITFNEAMSGLTTADFTVANGALSGLSSLDGGVTWTATLTPTASVEDTTNIITLDTTGLRDLAGNAGTGTTDSNNYAVDTLRPTATIVVADTLLTTGETTTATITFNEAVSGLTTADFTVANGVLSGLSSADGGVTWTATLAPNANIEDSSNLITLNNTDVVDAAGNTGTGATDSNNYVIDSLSPAVSSVGVPMGAPYSAGDTLAFVVNASGTVIVNGIPRLAIDMGGTTVFADYVSGSGTGTLVFQYIVQPGDNDADGITVTDLASNGATLQDAIGNAMNLALTNVDDSSGVIVDTIAPSASAIITADPSPTNAGSVRYIITFNEDVNGVDVGDFSLLSSGNAAGTLSSLAQIDSRTFQVTVTNVTGSGTLTLALNSSSTGISDAAGNVLTTGLEGQSYSLAQGEGDPEFRVDLPNNVVAPPPMQPTPPGLPPALTTSPLLPVPLFEIPTLGSGIPTLGDIFINQNALAPSFIAQVFASSSSDAGGDGSSSGFLGFGGGDAGVFGSSSLSNVFNRDAIQESEPLKIFDAKKWADGADTRSSFGAPTLGQQLHELHDNEKRQAHQLAMALSQFELTGTQAGT